MKIVTVTRTLIYTGPETWVQMCQQRSFAKLEKELGHGRKITSNWGTVQDFPEPEPLTCTATHFEDGGRTTVVCGQLGEHKCSRCDKVVCFEHLNDHPMYLLADETKVCEGCYQPTDTMKDAL